MRKSVIWVAALCALSAACGDSGEDNQTGFEQAFEDNFNKSFHEGFVNSCVSSAKSRGGAEELATKLCTCAADKINERYTVKEKMNLKNEQVMPIVEECRARFPS